MLEEHEHGVVHLGVKQRGRGGCKTQHFLKMLCRCVYLRVRSNVCVDNSHGDVHTGTHDAGRLSVAREEMPGV